MNRSAISKNFNKPDRLIFVIMVLFAVVTAFFNVWLAIAEFLFTAVYAVLHMISRKKFSEQLYDYLQSITLYLDEASKESLTRFPMPVTLLDEGGDVIWYNDLFHELATENSVTEVFGKNIDVIVSGFSMSDDSISQKHDVTFAGHHYQLFIMRQESSTKDPFYTVYWIDVNNMKNELAALRSGQLCLAYILIDSYDELPSSVTELQQSTFITRVDVKVRAFVKSIDGVMQKLDQEKYLVIFEKKHLKELERTKFKILSEVKEISVEGFHASLAMGIGCGDGNPVKTDIAARKALDTALSRGGDQAAILKGDKYSFYGGNSDGTQRRKRVKVRIIAEAFTAQVQNSDNVIIMGHKYADLDCVGAAIGVAKCVAQFGKTPYIVYNAKENLAADMYASFMKEPEYAAVFTEAAAAAKLITENTLLVIVDTHNTEYVESAKVLEVIKRVMVIDHHRRVLQNAITGTVINYHEPNASSCCEMVSELCENVPHMRLTKLEANALMSGIFLDTKTFTERTGVRTFEAAAYLKKQGADTAKVKEYFKSDIESYKKQIDIIADAVVIDGRYAISVWRDAPFEGIKLIASKAADEMLNLNSIEETYVIYPEGEDVHVSARSDSKGNVQIVCEKMGGGGHRNAAGAQVKNSDVDSVFESLKEILLNPESEEK